MDTFFATGRDDVDKLLRIGGWDQRENLNNWDILEIGCGAGRMTRHLATQFQSVTALDISGEMIRKARELNPALSNATFREGNGTNLHPLPDQSFDAVLSYIVFQHIPSRHIVYGYIEEALRVLKPGGQFLFQARNDFAHAETGTYAGDSVAIEDIQILAEKYGRSLRVIEGAGTQYCYFLIHSSDAGSDPTA